MLRGDTMSLQKVTKALADPVRRQILEMLKKETLTAGDIQKEFMISFAAISRHLSVLKEEIVENKNKIAPRKIKKLSQNTCQNAILGV